MGESSIEWTDATWNPVRGCVKVSPGCKNCYAETFAERWRGIPGHAYEQGFDPRLVPDKLDVPLRTRKPTTFFVNSMSDLFGDFVPDDYIAATFGVMAATPWHTYQILTKRAERMPEWFEWVAALEVDPWTECHAAALGLDGEDGVIHSRSGGLQHRPWPLPNVWVGVSVEDRKYGLPRLDHLRRVPAAVRFVSFEPLLEDLGDVDLSGIGWAIVGGESGHGARPFHIDWARDIVAQCRAAGVPVFVKQLGARPQCDSFSEYRGEMETHGLVLVSRKGGDMAEWPEDLRVREMPR